MDWILHLDTDELMHPAGAGEYSLRKLLRDIPRDVDMVVFPNYVSLTMELEFVIPFHWNPSNPMIEGTYIIASQFHFFLLQQCIFSFFLLIGISTRL